MKSFTIIASLFGLAAAGKAGNWTSDPWNKTAVSAAPAGQQAENGTAYGYSSGYQVGDYSGAQSLKKPAGYASSSTPVSAQNASIATEVIYTTTTWCPVASTAVDAQGHTYTTTISTLSTVTATSYLTRPHMATQTPPAAFPQNMTTTNIVYTTTTECPVTATTVDAHGSTITKTYTTFSTVTATDCLTIPLSSKGAYATGPASSMEAVTTSYPIVNTIVAVPSVASDVTVTKVMTEYTTTCPMATKCISEGTAYSSVYNTVSVVKPTLPESSPVAPVMSAPASTISGNIVSQIGDGHIQAPASSTVGASSSVLSIVSASSKVQIASSVPVAPASEAPSSVSTPGPMTATPVAVGTAAAPSGKVVTQIGDGQIQAPASQSAPVSLASEVSSSVATPSPMTATPVAVGTTAAPSGKVVTQIGDGQIQAPGPSTVGAASSVLSSSIVASASGNVQVASSVPVAPAAPSGKVVTQIGDGQIQAPASSVLSVLSSTKVAVPSSSTSSAARPSSTYTGAASKSTASLLSGILAIAAAVFLL